MAVMSHVTLEHGIRVQWSEFDNDEQRVGAIITHTHTGLC